MKNLILKIVLIGLLFGGLAISSIMLFSLALYYGLTVFSIYLPGKFLAYTGIASLIVGILSTAAWYIYLLILARKFFLISISTYFEKKDK